MKYYLESDIHKLNSAIELLTHNNTRLRKQIKVMLALERMPKPNPLPPWIDASKSHPDKPRTVLIHVQRSPDPVWLGYYADGCWHYINGNIANVAHYMELTALPTPLPKPTKSPRRASK